VTGMRGIDDVMASGGAGSGAEAVLNAAAALGPTALEMFRYGDHHVRVVLDGDGEPWFVLADLCRVLGLGTPARVRERLDRVDEGMSQTHTLQTGGGPQSVTVVSESGMYEVVIRSDKPEAVAFRRWITSEVLPSIRRTGSYSRVPAAPTALPSKKQLAHWVIEAEERAERAEAKVLELTPPAAAWTELADAAGDYSVADAAKVLNRDPLINTGERKLYRFMAGLGWVFRRDGRWKAYQAQVNNGRLTEKINEPFMVKGQPFAPAPTVRITPKGIEELHKRLGGSGQLALVAVS
jgi:anti-repressor protein